MRTRIIKATAVFVTGLLAGMFTYGALNVAQAFKAVPLDVRFTYHVALMNVNAYVMQITMGLAVLSALTLTVIARGTPRLLAGAATVLGVATFVITRFGNVPINQQIRQWVKTSPPADVASILDRWELLHYFRTGTAVLMFATIVLIAVRYRALRPTEPATT